MSDSGSGQRNDPSRPDRPDEEGYSGAPSWESSLQGGGWEQTQPYESAPNPFSREGSNDPDPSAPPSGQSAGSAGSASDYPPYGTSPAGSSGSAPEYPGYGPAGSGQGDWPGYPSSAAGQAQTAPQQPYAPYEQQPPPYQPYEQQAMPPYAAGGNPYDSNPYQVNPYQGSGYGVPQNHPQATTALVLGIIGLVLCPLVGIGGIVLGGKARKEIDAEPQRYSGRQMATAGWVLGIISVVYLGVLLVFLVIAGIGGALSS